MTDYEVNTEGWTLILEFGYGLHLYGQGDLRRAVNIAGRIVLEYTMEERVHYLNGGSYGLPE